MFSAFAAGLFLTVSGLLGWNVRYMRGWFEGGRWQEGPEWLQVALGAAFLALGVFWARRLDDPVWRRHRPQESPIVKHVGSGRTSRAVPAEARRLSVESARESSAGAADSDCV
jgi:hypothetical protein